MGRARSAIAAKCDLETLLQGAMTAYGLQFASSTSFGDFYDAVEFCRNESEELGGTEGQEAWIHWQHDKWSVLSDLSLLIPRNLDALKALSAQIGPIVVASIDSAFEYAFFAFCDEGKVKRLLVLEDEEIIEEGLPVPAERGQQFADVDEETVERLWTSYGLPTFDYDPADASFACSCLKTK